MSSVFMLKKENRTILSSISHINWSSRPQFVKKENNILLYKILSNIKMKMWYWVILNTSFNIHWKPIVSSPKDALDDFIDCGLDTLYIEWYMVKINK
jgi:carbamoyltransferase